MSRKLLFICAALMVAASGLAKGNVQIKSYDESGSKFGLELGYDHNWHYASTALQAITGSTKTDILPPATATINLDGFHIGPTYTYCFNAINGLYINGAIVYQYAIGKISANEISAVCFDLTRSYEEISTLDKVNMVTHTLEIPIRIGYNYYWENGIGINVYVGPSLNFALDWLIEGSSNDVNASMHLLYGTMYYKKGEIETKVSEDYLKSYNAFDIALGGGVGFSYKYMYLNLGCDWGLTNLCKHASFKTKYAGTDVVYTNNARSTQLKLTLGVRF